MNNIARVYMRVWDLQSIEPEVLNNYNLVNSMYVYVGQTSEKYFNSRTSKWKYDIKYRPERVEKNVVIFYNRVKKLYMNEFEMSESDFDNLFFNNNIILNEEEPRVKAREREKAVLNTLITMQPIIKNLTVLNYTDSNFKLNKEDNTLELSNTDWVVRMNFDFSISKEEAEMKLMKLVENDKIRIVTNEKEQKKIPSNCRY